MLLSYNELKKLGINIKIQELEKYFFQLGHEVEEVIDIGQENVVIGKVIDVKKHENADKLSICKVDVKKEVLQIVCGAPNIKKDQKVIVALNGANILGQKIKKVILKGQESNGMICSLEELGFDKKYLSKEDMEGIHVVDQEVKVGDDAFLALEIKDQMLDLFITANRGDCQSYRGLYNDMCALLNYNQKQKKFDKYNISFKENLKIEIENEYGLNIEQGSEYFTTRLIRGIEIQKSDFKTKLFLLKNGIKSQNNITDISNEILLKYGIPSHIYDADKIKGGLRVLKLDKEEPFIGLDEKEVLLPKNTLVIKDQEKIVCVAGVMGSFSTRVDEKTKNILVEVASFDSKSVFNSSKILGKKTESALRYEKKIDLELIDFVQNLICAKITSKNLKSKVSKVSEVGDNKTSISKVNLQLSNIKNILGVDIPKNDVIDILENLEFKVEDLEDHLIVSHPTYRKDIEGENDLIEEIIRIYNIDNIKIDDNIVSFSNLDKVIKNSNYEILRNIEQKLLKEELNQIVTYSLVSKKEIDQFLGSIKHSVKLMHPLSNEHEYYRQSLIPSLIKTCKENYSYQEKSVEFFEIAKTYILEENTIKEEDKLAILLSGEYQNYYMGAKRKYNFYDLKLKLENLFLALNIKYKFKNDVDIKQLNPYARTSIYVNEKNIGFIGEVVFDYDKKIKEKIFVLEINLEEIINSIKNQKIIKYKKISFLPKITRDITLEVKEEQTLEQVYEIFENITYLKDITLLDLYTGEHIIKGNKSMTFRCLFQDDDKTLTKEEIDFQMDKVFSISQEKGYKISGK